MQTLTRFAILVVLSSLLLFTGTVSCNNKLGGDQNLYIGAIQNNTANGLKASYAYFNGREFRKINMEAGQTVTFIYSSTVTGGELTMRVLDSEGKESIKLETGESGVNAIVVGQAASYTLEITGVKTKGSYDVKWTIK
jgi:hypothetical protein